MLTVIERVGLWFIAWILEDDDFDNIGALVGQEGHTSIETIQSRLEAAKAFENVEYWIVERDAKLNYMISAAEDGIGYVSSQGGYGWESKKKATAFKTLLTATMKNLQEERPLPEWTKEALKAGWKAPKGWKP
jgi:hypothetical protein